MMIKPLKFWLKITLFSALILPLVVQANVMKDLNIGLSPDKTFQKALNEGVELDEIIVQMIVAQINPITVIQIAVQAVPNDSVNIAATTVAASVKFCQMMESTEEQALCLKEVSQVALTVIEIVSEVAPDFDATVAAVAKVSPDPALIIAYFYPEPEVDQPHKAITDGKQMLTIPHKSLSEIQIGAQQDTETELVSPN